MKVEVKDAARADLRAIDRAQALAILHAVARYAATGEGDIKALHGTEAGKRRLRVGNWRVIFRIPEPDVVLVLRVRHRSEAYR